MAEDKTRPADQLYKIAGAETTSGQLYLIAGAETVKLRPLVSCI